ncbi:ATP-binding protein [Cesiribacter sp. SM1]|uniref:sensor histidine kinase n=1 Tax=Cesiribacter sp. SM1 TaxID=2861196 RepID=UPI001CD1E803|nr:HAMP domain-containing sensor histidine kinase [Cesiribacter sp. SM1]
MDWLDYLVHFTNRENRLETARKISVLLNAEDLIIFLKDPELNVLLPGIGFPQTLPGSKSWQSFLKSSEDVIYKGHVPYRDETCPAVAVRGVDGAIAVLIGGCPGDKDLALLTKILNITAPLLKQEQLAHLAESRSMHSARLAEKAERLTITLDATRQSLMEVIKENSDLLQLTKQQNNELAAANEELRASHEEVMAGLEELHEANQKLLSINADLDNFIYTASHDLKAPISNIEGLMIAMMRNLSPESRQAPVIQKLSGLITHSIERFKRTINDLTQITKIQKEGLGEDLSQVDLSQVISEVSADLVYQIEQANAIIDLELNNCPSIHFSAKNARSIVYNLLSNAIKYRSPERRLKIRISCYFEGEHQVLSIEDNGLGLDLSNEDKIYSMFKRLHDHVEGSGIGLYIVKKIIENAKGKIVVHSKLNEGSTFLVYFKSHNSSLK